MIGYYVDVAVGFHGNHWHLATTYVKDSDINREIDDECKEIARLAEKKILHDYRYHKNPISFTKVLWISDPEEYDSEEEIE